MGVDIDFGSGVGAVGGDVTSSGSPGVLGGELELLEVISYGVENLWAQAAWLTEQPEAEFGSAWLKPDTALKPRAAATLCAAALFTRVDRVASRPLDW
jgi:hypothetical protein